MCHKRRSKVTLSSFHLIELALFDVNFGFRWRKWLSWLEREAGQSELWSRDGVKDAEATPSNKNVDERVLEQRGKHEHKTDRHPDVDRLHVRDARHRRVDARRLRRGGQHGQQADGDARRTCFDVDPERDPGQDDDEQTW